MPLALSSAGGEKDVFMTNLQDPHGSINNTISQAKVTQQTKQYIPEVLPTDSIQNSSINNRGSIERGSIENESPTIVPPAQLNKGILSSKQSKNLLSSVQAS